jgi:hypothetical protein
LGGEVPIEGLSGNLPDNEFRFLIVRFARDARERSIGHRILLR